MVYLWAIFAIQTSAKVINLMTTLLNKFMRNIYLTYLSVILVTLVGCQSRYLDVSRQTKIIQITIPEEGYYVGSPVWLFDAIVVFRFTPITEASNPVRLVPDLRLHNISQNEWEKIPVETGDDCHSLTFSFLQRLPNHQLGFYKTCIYDNGGSVSKLQQMNIITSETQTLLDQDLSINEGQFSFSPDLSELVQEDMTGRFLSNKIYYKHDDKSTQIVPDFTRAMYPNWSQISREIAFWGTENYLESDPDELNTLPEVSALALYPFDLYISSPDGMNPQKILSSVQDPLFIKWSPKERTIAFSGTFYNMPGIWLVDASTSSVTRVWPTSVEFDWSPDGNRIVLVDTEKNQEEIITQQNILIVCISECE